MRSRVSLNIYEITAKFSDPIPRTEKVTFIGENKAHALRRFEFTHGRPTHVTIEFQSRLPRNKISIGDKRAHLMARISCLQLMPR